DVLSAERVGSVQKQAWAVRTRFTPGLALAGVVGTMTTARTIGSRLTPAELDARALALAGLREWQADGHVFNTDIQDIAAIRKRAGLLLPYFSEDDKVPKMFDALGDELCQRLASSDPTDGVAAAPLLKTGTHR